MSHGHEVKLLDAVRGQPRAVWITAFAAVIAFMGIGLVDPILLSIAHGLHAGPSQVTLLFASYLGVQVLAMLFTGALTSRIGTRRTMLVGLALIVLFAGLCAAANSIGVLVGLRAFWGLGNALFIATALTSIVAAASGGQTAAILLYEAALGLGISAGPIVGALLGNVSWRAPFLGTSVLMAVAVVLVAVLLPRRHEPVRRVRLREPVQALRDRRLFLVSAAALLYTFSFFTVLAWTPFLLHRGPFFVGGVFFGWGVLIAVFSVVVAPRLVSKVGEQRATALCLAAYALLMVAFVFGSTPVLVAATVASGAVSGCLNTMLTGAAMSVSQAPRAVASAGYNFLRWMGGAGAAILVGHVAAWAGSARAPFVVAIGTVALAAVAVGLSTRSQPDRRRVPVEAVLVGDEA